MFGYVMANLKELEKSRRRRYASVYCGICRGIRSQCSQGCRLGLSYDMAFLSLLLMSLYEPEETGGNHACVLHPGRKWTDSKFIRYGADMNVALAYYNALDDYEDEGKGTVERYATGAAAVQALLAGKVDCVVIDNEPAMNFVAHLFFTIRKKKNKYYLAQPNICIIHMR